MISFKLKFIKINTNPAGKIAEKAMWRSVFLTIWHCILNADSTKTPSSKWSLSDFAGCESYLITYHVQMLIKPDLCKDTLTFL